MARHRLFLALSPPPDVRAQLEQASRAVAMAAGGSGRATEAQKLHVTLAFLGNFDDDDAVTRALAAGGATHNAPFALQLDHAASFGPTWFLGSTASPQPLLDLHAALSSELARAGFELERRAFHPHVTFQRNAAYPLPPTRIAPIRWPVADFVLFDSFPAQSRYLPLASWML